MSRWAAAVSLDGALGDTSELWEDFLASAAQRFDAIAPLDPTSLPRDRGEASSALDTWAAAGVGDWRAQLFRFAEDHAPLYLRPSAPASSALRTLHGAGVRIGVFTDAPRELATVALGQLGATRRVDVVETGAGAYERVLSALGSEVRTARTPAELASLAEAIGR